MIVDTEFSANFSIKMNTTHSSFADYAPTNSNCDFDDGDEETLSNLTVDVDDDEDVGNLEEKRDDSQEKLVSKEIPLPSVLPTTIDSELVQRAFEALKKENAKLKSKFVKTIKICSRLHLVLFKDWR